VNLFLSSVTQRPQSLMIKANIIPSLFQIFFLYIREMVTFWNKYFSSFWTAWQMIQIQAETNFLAIFETSQLLHLSWHYIFIVHPNLHRSHNQYFFTDWIPHFRHAHVKVRPWRPCHWVQGVAAPPEWLGTQSSAGRTSTTWLISGY
jgi:hypothetical protein